MEALDLGAIDQARVASVEDSKAREAALGSWRQQFQRLDVLGTHRAEMSVIERRELWLAEPLRNGQHSTVHEADFEVGVRAHQLGGALVIRCCQVLDHQSASLHLIEDGAEGFILGVSPEQVIDLDQHGRGNGASLTQVGEQRRAGLVVVVVAIECRDDDAGVEDQRNGSGSKTSSLASLLKSPRPERNAPIQVRGGCSPSSPIRLPGCVFSLPSSCSSAVLTSCGTATPRSSASLRARSSSRGSTSTMFAGVAAMFWILLLALSAIRVEAGPSNSDHQGAGRDKDLAQRVKRAGDEAEIATGAATLAFDHARLEQDFQVMADGAL